MKYLFYTVTAVFALLLSGCADAGKSQTIATNNKVYFDVSGVKPDVGGKITQYNWEPSGDTTSAYDIYIFNNGSDHASFIAPDVSKETSLTFKLTTIESYKCKTSDDSSCKHHRSTDKVTITVTPGSGDSNSTTTTSRPSNTVTLSGKVKTLNNVALSGAVLKVNGKTITTRNDGTYRFSSLTTEDRTTVNVTHPDYFNNTRIVLTNQSGSYEQDIKLDKENITVTFAAQEGHNIIDNGANINFEAGDYLDNNAKKYTENVIAKMSYHNFKTSKDTDAFVGSYETTDGSTTSALLPYGFFNMSIADSTGSTLTIGKDTTITLAFPASDVASNDAIIPLWFYNKKLGYWLQDGEARRVNNQYLAEVTRMDTWGLFSVASKGSLQLCVEDNTGTALSSANIRMSGDKWSSNLIQTDKDGIATLQNVRADVKLKITASKIVNSKLITAQYPKSVTLSAGDNINLDDCIVLKTSTDTNNSIVISSEKTQLEKDAKIAQTEADNAKKASDKAKEEVTKAETDLTNAKVALSNATDDKKTEAKAKVTTAEATLKTKKAEAAFAKEKADFAQEKADLAKEKAKR